MKLRALSLLALMTLVVGCTHTEQYMVSVKNQTTSPITIGFTKEGEPYQDDWMSPEDLAIDRQINPETHSWGILIGPGKTASTKKPMEAELQADAISYVRVYRGDLNLLQILALGRNNPGRLDMPLMPGENSFIVSESQGKLVLQKGP